MSAHIRSALLRKVWLARVYVDKHPGALMGATLLRRDTGWNRFGDRVIPYLEGWFLFMAADVFQSIGGFDERYSPCDYEDVDFSYAAEEKGIKLVKVPMPLRHIGGQTGVLLPERREITKRNRIKFAKKWGLPNEES